MGDMDCEQLREFMCIDDNIATSEPLSDEAIVNSICGEQTDGEQNDEDEDESSLPPPSGKQAQDAVHILQQYLETTEGAENTLFKCVQKLGDFVNANNLKKCKQSKLTAFFKWDLRTVVYVGKPDFMIFNKTFDPIILFLFSYAM